MQEIHEDKRVRKTSLSHHDKVSRETTIKVVTLFVVVVLGAIILLTTKTGQQISGLKLNSQASLASKGVSVGFGSPVDVLPQYPVTSPVKGDVWKVGQSYKIVWNFNNLRGGTTNTRIRADQVRIELHPYYSCASSSTMPCDPPYFEPFVIAANEDNDGSFEWKISKLPSQYVGNNRIVITMVNAGTQIASAPFVVSESPDPVSDRITVTSPAKGDVWKTGESYKIAWNDKSVSFAATFVDISFQLPIPACLQASPPCMIRSISPYTIATKEANDGVFEWKIPTDLPGDYVSSGHIVVTLYQTDIGGKSAEFTIVRSSTPTPSDLTVTSPDGSERWVVGKTYTIKWTGGFAQQLIDIGLVYANSASIDAAPVVIATKRMNTGSYKWTVPRNLPKDYYSKPLSVVITMQGRQQAFSKSFYLANVSPLEIVQSPMTNGQAGVLYSHLFLVNGGQSPVQWSVTTTPSISGIYIKPTGMFVATAPNAGRYAVTVTVKDSAGQSASQDFRWFVGGPTERAHADGSLVLGLFGIPSSVCLIENGKLRSFGSAEIFLSHGYRWDKIVKANSADALLPLGQAMDYASGTLLRGGMSLRSYFLMYPNSVLRPFSTYEPMVSMGYKSQASYVTNPYLYKEGKPMTLFDAHPPGTDINDGGQVFRISVNNTKVPYPSIAVYNTWHTTDGDFSRVLPANGFDRLLPVSGMMLSRDVVSAIGVGR